MTKMKGLLFLLLASVIIGIATSKVINHPGVPTEWIASGRVEPNAKIQLIIAISQSEVGKENLEILMKLFGNKFLMNYSPLIF